MATFAKGSGEAQQISAFQFFSIFSCLIELSPIAAADGADQRG
jgi:hypothetical protein